MCNKLILGHTELRWTTLEASPDAPRVVPHQENPLPVHGVPEPVELVRTFERPSADEDVLVPSGRSCADELIQRNVA